jgi:GntR family galactonate operon transcriptional repressor
MSQPSLTQTAVDRIAAWIVGGEFAPGDVLPTEAEVGARLGVSRTVVREAMRTLAAKGMVIVRRRLGTHVAPLDGWSLFDPQVLRWRMALGADARFIDDLVEFRLGIEPLAAAMAARNPAFPADRLNAAFARMAAAADAPDGEAAWHAADLAFHQTILSGARNQFLQHLAPMIANTLQASFRLSVLSLDSARASLPMHRAAADAIIARDPEAAQAALEMLIRSAREDMVARSDDTSAGYGNNDAASGAQTPAAGHAREENGDLGDRRSADGAVLPPA